MSELGENESSQSSHFTLFVQLDNAHTVLQRILLVFSRRRIRIQGLQMFDVDRNRSAELQVDFESDADTVRDILSRLSRVVEVEKVWCESNESAAQSDLNATDLKVA